MSSEKISTSLRSSDRPPRRRSYTERLDDFEVLTDNDDNERLGRYYAEELCTPEAVPKHLRNYFDYAAYDRDIRLKLNCCFTSYGLVIDNR